MNEAQRLYVTPDERPPKKIRPFMVESVQDFIRHSP